MPNPRIDSPWIRLWEGQEDRAFITTMGFDVQTFRYLLEGCGHFADTWNSTPISRADVCVNGAPRLAGALGLTLHYLGSAINEVQLQQIFAVIPSVLSQYLDFSLDILLETLRKIKKARIALPSHLDEYEYLLALITARHKLLDGAFASIDGLALPVEVSDDPELENATYNSWKTNHMVTNVLMFSPEGTIIDCVLNAPGTSAKSPCLWRLQGHPPNPEQPQSNKNALESLGISGHL
ncbi:hypothetical protein C8R42DRAFT_643072 [Lentinula raphanica]|nr:hypothetical protein C8R42DRAFT_643072 [Lentinula raphanica]